ncbi:hypothetical protein [Variovorax sp. J22R115]|uniref:hypothetical protein n=1 Tax=Variovorax sp. J22R115 TaxID=3053509 RepID=UPI002576C034|nr:hypothetical protein [Variovorax sp. J22R115]MDM0053799.1 hypothetical protein [Variovorax sp. J22R115]
MAITTDTSELAERGSVVGCRPEPSTLVAVGMAMVPTACGGGGATPSTMSAPAAASNSGKSDVGPSSKTADPKKSADPSTGLADVTSALGS